MLKIYTKTFICQILAISIGFLVLGLMKVDNGEYLKDFHVVIVIGFCCIGLHLWALYLKEAIDCKKADEYEEDK